MWLSAVLYLVILRTMLICFFSPVFPPLLTSFYPFGGGSGATASRVHATPRSAMGRVGDNRDLIKVRFQPLEERAETMKCERQGG